MEQLEAYHHYCQTLFNLEDLICHFPSSNTPSLHLHIPLGSLAQRLFPPQKIPENSKILLDWFSLGGDRGILGPWACWWLGGGGPATTRDPPRCARGGPHLVLLAPHHPGRVVEPHSSSAR